MSENKIIRKKKKKWTPQFVEDFLFLLYLRRRMRKTQYSVYSMSLYSNLTIASFQVFVCCLLLLQMPREMLQRQQQKTRLPPTKGCFLPPRQIKHSLTTGCRKWQICTTKQNENSRRVYNKPHMTQNYYISYVILCRKILKI